MTLFFDLCLIRDSIQNFSLQEALCDVTFLKGVTNLCHVLNTSEEECAFDILLMWTIVIMMFTYPFQVHTVSRYKECILPTSCRNLEGEPILIQPPTPMPFCDLMFIVYYCIVMYIGGRTLQSTDIGSQLLSKWIRQEKGSL